MIYTSLILTVTMALTICASWFGLLQSLYCSHKVDRYFFVGATHYLNNSQKKSIVVACKGKTHLSFDQVSSNPRHQLQLKLKNWEVERE